MADVDNIDHYLRILTKPPQDPSDEQPIRIPIGATDPTAIAFDLLIADGGYAADTPLTWELIDPSTLDPLPLETGEVHGDPKSSPAGFVHARIIAKKAGNYAIRVRVDNGYHLKPIKVTFSAAAH